MADSIVLEDASGPVAPRFAHTTRITIERGEGGAKLVRDHRDASGAAHDEKTLDEATWGALVDAITSVVPLGTTLDLSAGRSRQKGVATNHATVTIGERVARLHYFSSHLDDDHGDPRARAVVEAIRAAAK